MEVSAIKHVGVVGVHGRSPLLRLQSDERLIALVRRGNHHAYEALVSRYNARLLAFCRHMLGSREDAEDVLQEVFTAAFNAITADERPINARPWLYRIARNRSLNHMRRTQAIGVDSMDVHFAEGGQSTADKVHKREEFRMLIADVQLLPETQKSALLLREIDALSYEQIAEAMETTVPSVKSLLVRARVGLAEAAEARQLTCEEVRLELGEVAEGLKRRTAPPVRRHLRTCDRCSVFRTQLKQTNKALAAVFPIGPLVVLRKLILAHAPGHAAGTSSASAGTTAAGTTAAGTAGVSAAGSTAVAGSAAGGGLIGAGATAVATKAVAAVAVAALASAGAIEVSHVAFHAPAHHHAQLAAVATPAATHALAVVHHGPTAASVAALKLRLSQQRHRAALVVARRKATLSAAHKQIVSDRPTTKPVVKPVASDAKPVAAPIEQGSSTTTLPTATQDSSSGGAVSTGTVTSTPAGTTGDSGTTGPSGAGGSSGSSSGSSGSSGSGSSGSQAPQGSPPPPVAEPLPLPPADGTTPGSAGAGSNSTTTTP